MYQTTSILDKPNGDEKISPRAIGYVSESAREELFQLVLNNCKESGITKATLARRLGKDPAQVTRMLGAPGNWTIDTVAEFLFAIDGSLLKASSVCAADELLANKRHATCFHEDDMNIKVVIVGASPKGASKQHIKNKATSLSW